ncbi:MAG: hypothetical protein AB1553_14675 [Nitrospirota bacterium]
MATAYQEPTGMAKTDIGFLRRISWGAIFAGTIVALVIELLLSLLGLGIGLGTVNPATEENPLGGVGIGAGIWTAISMIVALFAGGWVAARLAGYPRSLTGILHGVVVWGVATLFSFYLMTTALGMLVSGVVGVIGKGISLIGTGITTAITTRGAPEGLSPDTIMNQAQQLLTQRGAAMDPELKEALQSILTGKEVSSSDRQRVATMLAQRTKMSQSEAEQAVTMWVQQRQQAEQALQRFSGTAMQVTEQTMDTLSKAAILAFIALLLGGAAAAAGGALGTPKEIIATTTREAR